MPKKILIVDDEIGICKLLKIYLEKESFIADINGNGRTGLIKALNQHYDLIILDFLLPGINGYQVLTKLREIKSTPVIIVSSQDDENVMTFFMKSGANEFVVKPFDCKSMMDKVKKLIS
ncbi:MULTISPECIES: response regulator transcription factor [Bacillaceae]|uniref:response regulator transcription factor n=1 Tax=Bacillaceae TaxID=186817 RepID=UPI002FFF765C